MLTALTVRALFDYKDGELYWRIDIGIYITAGSLAGTVNKSKHRIITVEKIKYPAQDLIYLHHTGRYPYAELTHINGDTLDNRIENLKDRSIYEHYSQYAHVARASKLEFNDKSNTFDVVLNVFGKDVVLEKFKSHEDALSAFAGIKERLADIEQL